MASQIREVGIQTEFDGPYTGSGTDVKNTTRPADWSQIKVAFKQPGRKIVLEIWRKPLNPDLEPSMDMITHLVYFALAAVGI